tara:strand:+ start:525 stop:881 length:357 start_codon:yes stop_codon:yes gene_type:complete
MNKKAVVLLIEDWELAARLTKILSDFSIDLIFYDDRFVFDKAISNYIFIAEIEKLNKKDFNYIQFLHKQSSILIIGTAMSLNTKKIKKLNNQGFNMIMKKHELLKNLNKIIFKSIIVD